MQSLCVIRILGGDISVVRGWGLRLWISRRQLAVEVHLHVGPLAALAFRQSLAAVLLCVVKAWSKTPVRDNVGQGVDGS